MIRERSPLAKTALVTGVAVVVGLVGAFALERFPFPPGGPPPGLLVTLIRIELFVTTFNLVVLVALTGTYVVLYRDLPNKYTRSMLVLSAALLLYAITSNPYVPALFGFPPRPDFGPFVFLPDLFVGMAIVVIFYQSQA